MIFVTVIALGLVAGTDRALHGEDVDHLLDGTRTGRFERDGRQVASSSIHLPTTGGS